MDFVTPVLTPVVESMMVPIKKHLGFLVSSTNYVQEMGTKLKYLDARVEDIKVHMQTNNANSRMIPRPVLVWLEEVETIKTEAERIERGGYGCFNMKMKYRAGKQSSDILKKIADLIKEESEITWNDELILLAKVISSKKPSTSAPLHDGIRNSFESRDQIFKNALKLLESGNFETQRLALCGMGGVGKTTMMEQLKKAVEDSKMFDWIVKVVIGQNADPISIQKAISEKIGEPLTETTKDARSERLEKRFSRMSEDGKKKILIILDDVWVELNFKDIGLRSPFPNGFKLLLTSREEQVCTRMGVKKSSILRMEVLDEQEAKSFFREFSGLTSNGDQELLKIGNDIAKMCGGLPIALKIIASTLRDNYIKDVWEDTLFRLQINDFQDLKNIVNEIFEISYKNLKEDEDRAIFQLSSLFPDDFDIRIEDLLRYAWGLKLFKNVNTLATTRRRTNTCVNNLIRSNLLIKSDCVGCVKMHDLVRDFVLSNFSKFKQASIVNYDNKSEWPTQDTKDSCERVLLKCTGMSEFPVDFYYPNLKLLNLMGGKLRTFPHDFYERMEKLEVLAYESMTIPLLSKMQYSTTLRTLCLRSCGPVVDISFYGNLINLEILSFADCGIRKLPSTIGNLRKLKLLDLTGCDDLCIDDGVFQNLVNLEELYMIGSERSDTIRFTDTNCDELEMLSMNLLALEVEFFKNKAQPTHVSFKKLERFKISIGCTLKFDNKDSSKNSLSLNTNLNELLECKINELFKKTEQLYLQVCDMNHLEDLSIDSQHSFCNLTVLWVFGCEVMTYLFTIPVVKGLSKLVYLVVDRCPILESLVHGESDNSGVEMIIFQKLEYLKLKDLPRLVCLCNTVNVIELPQLMGLRLEGIPNFTSIFPENKNNNSAMTPLLNKDVIIPKLEKLIIEQMENLKQIWSCDEITTSEEVNNISMLKKIIVGECDSLVNLFPSNPMPLLNHLEKIELYRCKSIEVLFNIDLNHCVGKIEQVTNNSLKSIRVYTMEKLKEVWRIKGANNSRESHPHIGGFHAVKNISIKGCKIFKSICTPATINFRLGALIGIKIDHCWTTERTNESVKNSHEQQVNVISKEEIFEFDDNISTAAFTSHAIDTFHQLRHLTLGKCYGVDVVFDIESPSSTQQPLLPYLEHLQLTDMEMMSHMWKCNWNEFFILQKQHPESSFQNLTTISMWRCNRIKYLFSPLMAKLLSNLKYVNICFCDGIEEVVSNRDDEEMSTSTPMQTNTTLFPNLDSLTLLSLVNLKRIDGTATTTAIYEEFKLSEVGNVSWSLCQSSREIFIDKCETLSSVVPSYAIGQTQKLEVVKVNSCKQMMELFETPQINSGGGGGGGTNVDEGPGGANVTHAIPRLKNIITLKLPNLQILEINNCDALEYIFTFCTLESLRHLKELSIKSCREMRVITKEEHREQTMTSKNVVFPCLKSLTLSNLPNLVGFYLGMNGFQWPLLEDVKIYNCPRMTVFTHGESTSPNLKYIRTSLGKYSHDCGLNFLAGTTLHQTPFPSLDHTSSHATTLKETRWSFHDLIEIDVKDDETLKKIVPSGGLLQVQKLEKIQLTLCELVEEVFEVALEGTNSGFIESLNVVEFSKLREVYLEGLCSLKYIWKSNQWTVFKFPNLTKLFIHFCKRLEHVFTSSMVGSLLQLQELHIQYCGNLEVIVKEEEWDVKVKETTILPHLKFIKLWHLQSLKGFCLGNEAFSWPTLDTLEIKECPEITIFTMGHLAVPEVTKIETSSGLFYAGEDVNSFIKTKKEEGFEF